MPVALPPDPIVACLGCHADDHLSPVAADPSHRGGRLVP